MLEIRKSAQIKSLKKSANPNGITAWLKKLKNVLQNHV